MLSPGSTAAISALALLGCAATSARRGSAAAPGGGPSGTGAAPPAEIARASLGTLTVDQVAARQRARGGAAARSAGHLGQLHDLVPRRLAQRGRGGRRDRPGAPVRAPDVHADQERRRQRLRQQDGRGRRQHQRDDLLRLHRLRRRHPADGDERGDHAGGRSDGQPRSAQEAGGDRARRGRRGAPLLGRGQRRRDPRRADVRAGLQDAPLPLAGDRLDEGHQGDHPGEGGRLLQEVLRAQQRGAGDRRQDRRGGDAVGDRRRLRRRSPVEEAPQGRGPARARAAERGAHGDHPAGPGRSAGDRLPGAGAGGRPTAPPTRC